MAHIRSRDHSEEQLADYFWYHTRVQSAKNPLLREVREARVLIGNGAFGVVYQTVKVVDLRKHSSEDDDHARAALHREVKFLEKLSHVSC
jgi:predicted Ser/Thr protein kinase